MGEWNEFGAGERPGPPPLPRPSPCAHCGGQLSTTPGVIQTVRHAEDCWKHPRNACADCQRQHPDPEMCVFNGRRFDSDAHELVQTAQLALEHAVRVRQPGLVNAYLWWDTLEAHLTVLIDDLPAAFEEVARLRSAINEARTVLNPRHGDWSRVVLANELLRQALDDQQ